MRLAFLYPNLNIGGQQTYTIQLMRALSALGHTCMYAFNTDGPLRPMVTEFADALRFPLYPSGPGRSWAVRAITRRLHSYQTTRHLRRLVCDWQPDAIFTANIDMGLLVGDAIADRPVLHYKLIGHSLTQVNQHYVPVYKGLAPRLRMTGYFGSGSLLREYAQLGVPSQQLHSVPDAVDAHRFKPLPSDRRSAIRERLGVLTNDFVLGWVGRLAPECSSGTPSSCVHRFASQASRIPAYLSLATVRAERRCCRCSETRCATGPHFVRGWCPSMM